MREYCRLGCGGRTWSLDGVSSNTRAAKRVPFEAVLFRGRREEPAPEEGPDSLCRTRTTIQPERTMIRSNLWPAMPVGSARGAKHFRY